MARYIFYALVIVLLYKLIFDFIIPIFITTKKMRDQFAKAKQQMEEHQNANQPHIKTTQDFSTENSKIGEYIEFEEIRK